MYIERKEDERGGEKERKGKEKENENEMLSVNEFLILCISFIASILDTAKRLPQLYKTFKTKNVNGMSVFSLILMCISNLLWLLHGYLTIMDYWVILANVAGCFTNGLLITMYFVYKNNDDERDVMT